MIVLWVVLAMSMLAISFSAAIRTEVDAARNVIDQKQAYYMARAGIEYAVYKVLESQLAFYESQQIQEGQLDTIPEVFTGALQLQLAEGIADVEVIDETGKINLNLVAAYSPHLIFNLLIMVGIEPQEADLITDSIVDWYDHDDFVRPNGAESNYYQALEEPYSAKNSSFDVPEELLLVQGVTPEIYYGRKGLTETGERVEYYGLQKYFTTFTNINRINVNAAPIPVLAAIPGLDYDTAVQIYTMRQQTPFNDPSEIQQAIPGISGEANSYLSTLRSNVFSLVSSGRRADSNVINRIRAVVRIDGIGEKGYAVLYWNESNLEL